MKSVPLTPQTRKVTLKHGETTRRFVVDELDDWQEVANALAHLVRPGSIVALSGPLGAGKTTLVQYLASTLGASKRAISPTFALMRIYKVRSSRSKVRRDIRYSLFDIRRLVHVDAYRIEDEKDLIALDLDEELLEPGTVMLIEWPENMKGWLKGKKTIQVRISI